MKNLHTKFKNRKIKSPNRLIAFIVQMVLKHISKKHNTKFIYDKSYLEIADKQMLLLCQHKSCNDYIYVFAGLKKRNVHILCGYQNVFQKGVYHILKSLGVIAKMLYQPDIQATRQIFQAVKLGNSIAVFPEGIQSTSGSTHPINPATIKLLMKLKLPVALVTLKGTYFSKPRYSKDLKTGEITVKFSKLFDSKDFETYSQNEIYNRLLKEFQYNEFEEHRNHKVAFRGKKPNIYGLDNIIYKCPHCLSEHKFSIQSDVMLCTECGFSVSMDEYYDIHQKEKKLSFKNIDEWYKWQRVCVAKEVAQDEFQMSVPVIFRTINTQKLTSNYSLKEIGKGTLTISNKGLKYTGTQNGSDAELLFDARFVYSLSMSLQYDLDLYYKDNYYNFLLTENQKTVVKWMLAAEEVHNLYDEKWGNASKEVYTNA